jgi:NAD(P) transhydrogenase subunit alpha
MAKVQRPTKEEIGKFKRGTVLVALLSPGTDADTLGELAKAGTTALALELVPRITRAQSMDVLSSQSTVAGYKAVLIAADAAPRLLPMLTTAAGSLAPAKVFVLGAGVAGLQAIATARRLGGVVSAFDVRAAAAEQVLSLGATFVAADQVGADAESKGGYAKAQSEEQQQRTVEAIARHVATMDIVITTAQVPGRPAPRLITGAMVASMKPGSVIVDLAAESGGNCALTRAGETVESGGVRIIGPVNIASTVPYHASQMFSKNVVTLLQHITKDGNLAIDLADEITGAMAVTHDGAVKAESRK